MHPPTSSLGALDFSGSEYSLDSANGNAYLDAPGGVWSDGTRLYVADTGDNRVMIWNTIPTTNGAAANIVLGQTDWTSRSTGTSINTESVPAFVMSDGTNLYVADTGNNRVLIWNSIPTTNNASPNLVVGQSGFTTSGSGSPVPV